MSTYSTRVDQFKKILTEDKLDLHQLRQLCFNGIPDIAWIRPLAWRLLLGYLPAKRSGWDNILKAKRDLYDSFLDDIIINPSLAADDENEGDHLHDVNDHPLSLDPESQWVTYFKDNEVLSQIDKDARRLYPDMSFFQKATEFPCKKKGSQALRKRVEKTVLLESKVTTNRQGVQKIKNKSKDQEYHTLSEGEEAHWEVVERMLFIYAKLNPGIGYVQGMNEIMGPIYYIFAVDSNSEWKRFWMQRVCQSIRYKDSAVWQVLEDKGIRPEFYCFRWFTLLLSQEFPLPDVIRIWDSLFAEENRFEFLLCVCCAMLMWVPPVVKNNLIMSVHFKKLTYDFTDYLNSLVRDEILQGEFADIIKTLQNYPVSDVHIILKKAAELRGM
ncbi:uncharacterized protein TRIADDRAFT_53506 [Trichoplax adhaerens]|uniref:Rab-GAP TBC domain-containing protein n=1 Tax=Trichoplax adhaerens TaxID=10228 RepID=B3RPE5_TRIAD|nr:hypothetical protein TRIADDRAFT_53506 [Trichoplax adhaerens]EDV28176.1 hypothetical protein TRIADDRAFT_53506 [Trichoplax adhaerens]|eukprot:XP_002110010.1 hypothetical protein TRIADDRAFT_53506 [Trichoplax adhaerens]